MSLVLRCRGVSNAAWVAIEVARTARRCLVASYFFLCTKKGSPAQGEAILAQAGTSAVGCFANRIVSKGSRQQSDAHQSVGSYEELDKGTHTYSHTHTLARRDMTVLTEQAKAFTLPMWGL